VAPDGATPGESTGAQAMLTAQIRGGSLFVKRGEMWTAQLCPFCRPIQNQVDPPCGEWCPLFGETLGSANAAPTPAWLTIKCGTGATFKIE
jgi:hypothetical protein